jgi:hypothetical protein
VAESSVDKKETPRGTDIVTTPRFWRDHEYDLDNADSRSTSRYSSYLFQSA